MKGSLRGIPSSRLLRLHGLNSSLASTWLALTLALGRLLPLGRLPLRLLPLRLYT